MRFQELVQVYPYCYHVTFATNLLGIRDSRAILSARMLMVEAGRAELVRSIRHTNLILDGPRSATIRNQRAISPQLLHLPETTLGDYISYLNSRTYFYPGGRKPSYDTVRLWRRADLPSFILRIPTQSLIRANSQRELLAADCNVGATWSKSHASVTRRATEFRFLNEYVDSVDLLTELSMLEYAQLPADAEFATRPGDNWMHLV